MELSAAGAIFWFVLALYAIVTQYLILPVASTDQSISATVIVGLPVLVAAPILAFIFSALWGKISVRLKRNWLKRSVCTLLAIPYAVIMLGVVASPFLYFVYATGVKFDAYPTTRELPVEKAAGDNACNSPPLLAIISDTHITDEERTLENKTDGIGKLRRVLTAIRNVCPRLLVISGDLTDQGEQKEWELFGALLQELDAAHSSRGAGPQVLLVPGNHDLQGTPYTQGGEIIGKGFARTQDAHLYAVRYLARKRHFLELAQAKNMLMLMAVSLSMPAGFAQRVDEVLAAAAKKEHVETDPGFDGGLGSSRSKPSFAFVYPKGFDKELEGAQTQFDDLFPMIHEDVGSGLTMVLLNSSAHLSPGQSMGLGSLGATQIQRLEKYLSGLAASKRPVRSLVVVLHHAPLKRATDAWSWQELRQRFGDSSIWAHTVLALDVNDAQRIVALLDNIARSRSDMQVVLVHGHRHGRPYLGQTASGVLVVEADGVIEDHRPGFWAAYQAGGTLAFKWLPLGP